MNRAEAIMILKNEQPHCGKRALFPEEKRYEAYDVAIEALEQQTCEDAISRQAVLDIFADNADAVRPYSKTWEEVKALPSVNPQPKTGWTPVSEESLPKEDNEVLITIKSCGNWYVCHSVYRDGQFWQKNFEYHSYRKPIAWMPLPKPYKAESEDGKCHIV